MENEEFGMQPTYQPETQPEAQIDAKQADMKKWLIPVVSVSGAVIIIAFLITSFILFKPLMKFRSMELELGDAMSTELSDYVKMSDAFFMKNAELDISEVNSMKVGEYFVTVKFIGLTYTYRVEVVDTTAPTLQSVDGLYVAIGRALDPQSLVTDVYDISGDVTISFEDASMATPTVLGEYTVTVLATDESGNVGSVDVSCTVETPPYVIGALDDYAVVGTGFDPTRYVVAIDELDGVLTGSLSYDLSTYNADVVGDYVVSYTSVNAHGLATTVSQTIHIVDDMGEHITASLSAEDITLLKKLGYFSYQLLDAPDKDATLSMVAPTLLNFYTDQIKPGLNYLSISGSGFIYKIDTDYMYLSTNTHVAADIARLSDIIDVRIYNGEKFRLNSYPEYKSVDGVDISMYRVPISDVPVDILLQLKEVYYEEGIDETMENGTQLVAYAPQWDGGKNAQIKSLEIYSSLNDSTYDFVVTKHGFNSENYFYTSPGVVGGMSGTGIFDYYGRLVGNCSHTVSGPTVTNCCVNVDNELTGQLYTEWTTATE